MPLTNGYTTTDALRGRLGNNATSVAEDKLEHLIEAASREIDGICNRRFYQAVETRIFTAEWSDLLEIDDLTSLTTIETDDLNDRTYSTSWSASDYELEPANNAFHGHPYTSIQLGPNTTKAFPTYRRGVRINGTWGWPSIPQPIEEACLLIAVRLHQSTKAPYGTAGTVQDGAVQYTPRVDPVVRQLLDPYRRMNIGAAGGW